MVATVNDSVAPNQRMGSTATILLAQQISDGKGWAVTCAWVGDSRAATVLPGGVLCESISEDHRLELPREEARVMEYHKSEGLKLPGQRLTVVANRVCNTTGQVGPRVVFNEKTGVSLMMTRYPSARVQSRL